MIWTGLTRYRDIGLLLLRVGMGVMFILHGWPKLMGGPEMWRGLAGRVGIGFFPEFFGLMAGIGEAVGGLLLALGLFFRPATLLLSLVMIGAASYHLRTGDPFVSWSRPVEMLILFVALFLIGPGKYSIDRK